MEKFKILWLDDDFVDENGSDNLPLPLIRGRYPQLEIVTMQYVDWCEAELRSNSESYQAVILDANGKYSHKPTLEPNKIGFEDNISIAQNKGLPVYLFSGQLEIKEAGDQADITKRNLKRAGFVENVNLFFKSGTYKLLLDKVLSDLKSDFAIFYKYPLILDNVIHYGVNKDCVKELLLWMEDNTLLFPDYDSLRRIVYDEAIELRLKGFFGKDIESIQKDYITEECMSEWEKAIIFGLLKDLLNAEVHNWPSDDINSKMIISHAFITVMNWYNRFMHKIEVNPNPHDYYTLSKPITDVSEKHTINFTAPKLNHDKQQYEGVVEKDKNGFYVVGNHILKPDWGEKHLGKRVRVTKDGFFWCKKIAYKCEEVKLTDTSDFAEKLKLALK